MQKVKLPQTTKGNKMLDMIFDTENWKMERKYVIRRRVFFTIVVVAVVAVAWSVAGNLWWTETGYCWGSLDKCLPEYFGK